MNNKNKLFTVVLILCVISLLLGILSPVNKKIQSKKNSVSIKEIVAQNNKIAVIKLDGVISSESAKTVFGEEENSSLAALSALNSAEDDKNVKGVILRINSPGGTVGMSQRLYSAVINLRKKKPVIAVMDDIATSGGYYVASAADRIVALPGTMTGSIGVIMSTIDAHELLSDKLGIRDNVIKSGEFKDIGSSTRPMTDAEHELLQDMVNDSFDQFREAIIKGRIERKDKYAPEKRELTIANLDKYADGRVFTGRQAVEYGFIDSIGGSREARAMMIDILKAQRIDVSKDSFVSYGKSSNFFSSLGINPKSSSIESFLPQSLKYSKKPLYLWE